MYIYINKVKVTLVIAVEGDPKVPFSIPTTPECRVGRYFFLWINLGTYLIILSFKQGGIKYHFWVFGMTWWLNSSLLGHWQTLYPLDQWVNLYIYIYIYIYIWLNNRHFLSTYLYVHPFELLYWFSDIRRELVDKSSIISYFPSTFYPTLGHHRGRVYYRRDVTFVCTLLLCKNESLYCCIV